LGWPSCCRSQLWWPSQFRSLRSSPRHCECRSAFSQPQHLQPNRLQPKRFRQRTGLERLGRRLLGGRMEQLGLGLGRLGWAGILAIPGRRHPLLRVLAICLLRSVLGLRSRFRSRQHFCARTLFRARLWIWFGSLPVRRAPEYLQWWLQLWSSPPCREIFKEPSGGSRGARPNQRGGGAKL
jgi:hypothetical protein